MKVVCVDCSARLDVDEKDLKDFVCDKCGCDDYQDVPVVKTTRPAAQVEQVEQQKEDTVETEHETPETTPESLDTLVDDLSHIVRESTRNLNKLTFDYEDDGVEIEVTIRKS